MHGLRLKGERSRLLPSKEKSLSLPRGLLLGERGQQILVRSGGRGTRTDVNLGACYLDFLEAHDSLGTLHEEAGEVASDGAGWI